MDITIYDIIKGPVITDKAYKINSQLKQLIIHVHMNANKPLVKEALEKLFNVKVEKIRIAIRKPKLRMAGRRPVQGRSTKKAFVTLKEGYSIDVLGQYGTDVVADDRVQQQAGVQE